MRSTWLKRPVGGICISLLLGLTCCVDPATAWQFRDLDDSATEVSPSDAEDLVPTSEEFMAPIIDASELEKLSNDDSGLSSTKAPDTVTRALQGHRPKAASRQEKPKVTSAPPQLEPVPMPELDAEGKSSSPAVTSVLRREAPSNANPMAAFANSQVDRTAAPNPQRDVRTAKFNNVQPGLTKVADLKQTWGEPVKTIDHHDGIETFIYKVPSFRQVDVTVNNNEVSSILVHLLETLPVSHVAEELNLTEFAAVPIPDEFGEVLGQAYPERGILLNFTDDLDSLRVSAILLEPISGEMFRLRALHDFEHQYERSLADLDDAIRIDPTDAGAYWLKSKLEDVSGRSRDALKTVQKAIRLSPTNPLFRLTRARLLAKTNEFPTAVEEVQAVLDEIEMPAEVAARAHCLLGDLLALGPDADHQKALEHHLKAIDFGMKVVDDRRFAIRRMAKHVLVDAHMSMARDIALGNFQRQAEVVPKWLLRASELADEFVSDDQGDELLQMHILRNTLACYGSLPGRFDAAVATEEALRTGREFITEATDETYKTHVERLLAETLMHSAKIERSRGRYDAAIKHANNALALLNNSSAGRQETSHDRYLEASLDFLLGSLYAVQQEDHQEAVEWYNKARDIFVDSDLISPLYTDREHGEMLVSMGLSFWEIGEHEDALALTTAGAELMKEAVEKGSLQVAALVIPYGNLAAMHSKLGHDDESQEFTKLVAKVEKIVPQQTRR